MKKRLTLLAVSALISGFLYIPFINASDMNVANLVWILFPIGSALGILLLGWPGLIFVDKSILEMPILSKWESGEKINKSDFSILIRPIFFGIAFAIITYALNRCFSAPKNPGTFIIRILTAPWAGLVTETISHLFVMTGLFLIIKNRWISIVLSSFLFLILFHLNGVGGDRVLALYMGTMNFTAATLTGWIYSKYGFESAIASHTTMHLILLGLN
jgi:hypothetical protein